MINTVIFDWSGVLSDDWLATFKTSNDVLEVRGHERLSEEKFRELYELPWVNFYKKLGIGVGIKEEYELWEQFFPNHAETLRPFPGARETLKWLNEKGVKCVLLSAHNEKLLKQEVEKYGFGGLIEAADGNNFDKRERIEKFIEEHGIEKESAIYVGDMCHDIETARMAGVTSVAVLTGYDSKEKLEAENPDYIIDGVHVLPDLIERMGGLNG